MREELCMLLNSIDGAYFDFVSAIMFYAEKKSERLEKVLEYIKNNPGVNTSDVVKFVSDQPDFYEDAAYQNVV